MSYVVHLTLVKYPYGSQQIQITIKRFKYRRNAEKYYNKLVKRLNAKPVVETIKENLKSLADKYDNKQIPSLDTPEVAKIYNYIKSRVIIELLARIINMGIIQEESAIEMVRAKNTIYHLITLHT